MDHGGRDWSDEATSLGIPAATRSWERQRTDSPQSLQRAGALGRLSG